MGGGFSKGLLWALASPSAGNVRGWTLPHPFSDPPASIATGAWCFKATLSEEGGFPNFACLVPNGQSTRAGSQTSCLLPVPLLASALGWARWASSAPSTRHPEPGARLTSCLCQASASPPALVKPQCPHSESEEVTAALQELRRQVDKHPGTECGKCHRQPRCSAWLTA